jgi:hypothetical protein
MRIRIRISRIWADRLSTAGMITVIGGVLLLAASSSAIGSTLFWGAMVTVIGGASCVWIVSRIS